MPSSSGVALEVAVGPSSSVRRGEGIGTSASRRKWILAVAILIRTSKRYQLVRGGRRGAWSTRSALEGIVARIGHHTGGIPTGSWLLGDVCPLVVRMMWRRPGPGRAIGVVVVAVQTFGVDGLRSSPSRPRFVL